jgi:hypothetical protein
LSDTDDDEPAAKCPQWESARQSMAARRGDVRLFVKRAVLVCALISRPCHLLPAGKQRGTLPTGAVVGVRHGGGGWCRRCTSIVEIWLGRMTEFVFAAT